MICILSYCNTTRKKKQLSSLLQSLKINLPEQKIIVYSHYKNVEPQYYDQSDYYIYDYSNPKSTKSFCDWIVVNHQKRKFYRWGSDWGFAVFQMIRRSSMFIKAISDEGCLFLNYDVDPTKLDNIDILQKASCLKSDQIGVFSLWGGSIYRFNMACFYLDLPKIENAFFEKINHVRYNAYNSVLIPEDIFKIIIDDFYVGKYSTAGGIPLTFSESSRHLVPGSLLNKFFSTLLPSRNNLANDKRKCLAAWNCTEIIETIAIKINGKEFILQNQIQGENRFRSFFSPLPDINPIDKIEIIAVNQEQILPSEILEGLDEDYWSNNYHEDI